MFILKKATFYGFEYFQMIDGVGGTLYKLTENESDAYKFSSEAEIGLLLQRSGFNGHMGWKTIKI